MLWRPSSSVRPSAGFIEPCLPTASKLPPCGPQWVYEIKHDGYRLMVRKANARVRIYTRRGVDWTERFPRIVQAVQRLRASSIMLDGEGVVCGSDGISDFNRLHSKHHDQHVFLYAFDLLEVNGDDSRRQPLEARKKRLRKLLARSKDGIQYNEHVEDDGHVVYEHACKLGFEGIVAKRIDLPYKSGRAKCWITVRNPRSAAMLRIEDGSW